MKFAGTSRANDRSPCVKIGKKSNASRAANLRLALMMLFSLALVVGSAIAQASPASGAGPMTVSDALKALGAGVLAGLVLSGLVVAAFRTGISPLPKPLCVAFMEAALHQPLALASGLASNVLWVAFWSFYYVFVFWRDLTLIGAFGFALILWLLVISFFFPAVGWGFFGRKLGPLAIVDATVSHFLFALVIWGVNLWVFGLGPILGKCASPTLSAVRGAVIQRGLRIP